MLCAWGCGGSIGDFFQRVFVSPSTRTLRALGDRLKIDIPANTFTQAVTFLLADVVGLSGLPGLVVASAFDFRVDGQAPAKDMNFEFKFDPAKLGAGADPADARLYRVTSSGPELVAGSSVDVARSVVLGPVRSEGRYVVAAPEP